MKNRKLIKKIVRIITWDGVEYDRETSDEEIDEQNKKGNIKYIDEKITFDFKNSQ